MTFEEYYQRLPVGNGLGKAKKTALKRLWHNDSIPFPKPWVSSEELRGLTEQQYFDRRAREIRDHLGCDLETAYREEFRGHGWRLKSANLKPPTKRDYLTQKQKTDLFVKADYTCSTCGTTVEPGVKGLQADHKRPLSREGTNELENWQAMCHNCNVGKRRACVDCTLDCHTCSWAFPEKHGIPLMLNLGEYVLREIDLISKKESISREELIEKAIDSYKKAS